ncbi:MAG TPA: hypothetical protein VFT22_14545 [Kofleriaceae bacterium]|nr:hypothetical protein [Kofleriaceae bacterium]
MRGVTGAWGTSRASGASLAVIAALAVLLAGAAPAFADARAEAVVLFDQGIKDMKAGRLDKACEELQASLELVKDSGTKGALARCHGLAGRIATAWLLWRELSDTAPTAELRADAAAHATRLEPRLPRYTMKLAQPMPDLVVEINGRSVPSSVPVAVPIDPGKLTVTATRREGGRDDAPALSQTWKQEYTAVEGRTVAIDIPLLALRATDRPAAPRPPPGSDLAARRHQRHVIALVMGGVAVAAAGTGTYFGLAARSDYDRAKQLCGGAIHDCPEDQLPASQRRVDDARSEALRSTIAFGAAAGIAVVAGIVWATTPSLERKGLVLAPTAGPASIGVVLGGPF